MHIQVILGSIREGRRSGPVAQWAFERASARTGVTVELIDLKTWALPLFDFAQFPSEGNYRNPLQKRWADTIARADGYIFVSPEYNHGYTAALKNALDYLYAEWNRKPASFVSFGNAEGARGIQQLRLVLVELEMAPQATAVHLRSVTDKIHGGVFIPDPREEKRFGLMMDELVWWGDALRGARDRGSPWVKP